MLIAALVSLAAGSADLIVIDKSERRMVLYDGGAEIARYRIALGFAPEGDKERQGDGKTPEGRYRIDFKNPRSQFHLSLKISYPDAADRAAAEAAGADPGGDIFIHGTPGTSGVPAALVPRRDWTLGCIAVSNGEIEEIWRLVEVGTAVEIGP
jgi:murein L,D-transpeptidase YafK